jgi:hypothetical protein
MSIGQRASEIQQFPTIKVWRSCHRRRRRLLIVVECVQNVFCDKTCSLQLIRVEHDTRTYIRTNNKLQNL